MEPVITDWEKLIPPVDPADIPVSPPPQEAIPESSTIETAAVSQASILVHRNAVIGTAKVFTDEMWPNRDENLWQVVLAVAVKVTLRLKDDDQWATAADYDQQVAIAAIPIRALLIEELRLQLDGWIRGHDPLAG